MLAKTKKRGSDAEIPTEVEKNEKPDIKMDKGRIKKIWRKKCASGDLELSPKASTIILLKLVK